MHEPGLSRESAGSGPEHPSNAVDTAGNGSPRSSGPTSGTGLTTDADCDVNSDVDSDPDHDLLLRPWTSGANASAETWGAEPDEIAHRRAADIRVAEIIRSTDYDLEDLRTRALMEQLRTKAAGSLVRAWEADELFPRAAKLGCPFPMPPPQSWPDEAYMMLNEAAWSAGPRFVERYLRKWSPTRGASIATFYTNFVIGSDLKTSYCALLQQETRGRRETSLDEAYPGTAGAHLPDPQDELARMLDRLAAEEALRDLQPDQAELLWRLGAGDRPASIARERDVHPKTLGRQIQRLQRELTEKHHRPTEGGGR